MSLFIAWMPDGQARERLAALREACRRVDTGGWASWRNDAQLHMTLRFLAHVPPQSPTGLADTVTAVAQATGPFEITFDRVEAWASALVARTAPNDALRRLLSALNDIAMRAGYAEMDPQTPHLTLAYPPRDAHGRKRRIAQVPAFDPSLLPIAVPFDQVAIVQTVSGGYQPLKRWSLARPRP